MTSAVILLRPGVETDRQFAVALPYVEQAGYTLDGVVSAGGERDAAAMACVVVAAFAEDGLAELVAAAGGRLEAVRRSDYGRATVRGILAVLYRDERWSVAKIAQRFGMGPNDVVDHLRRAGVWRTR